MFKIPNALNVLNAAKFLCVWPKSRSDQLQLAKVVLFDQIPWNVFRGTSDAFRYDEKACRLVE